MYKMSMHYCAKLLLRNPTKLYFLNSTADGLFPQEIFNPLSKAARWAALLSLSRNPPMRQA